jgi:hypothetical protein
MHKILAKYNQPIAPWKELHQTLQRVLFLIEDLEISMNWRKPFPKEIKSYGLSFYLLPKQKINEN